MHASFSEIKLYHRALVIVVLMWYYCCKGCYLSTFVLADQNSRLRELPKAIPFYQQINQLTFLIPWALKKLLIYCA